jgi:chromosome segregation ATPase
MNNMNNNLMSNSNPNFALQNKIEMLNREMQMKESEYIKEREMIKNRNAINEQKLNQTISNDNKKIEELKIKINQLNKEIINNKRKQNIFEDNNNKYAKQIEEMNNNILSLNQIIEQKDKLISQLNSNRNNELSSDINNNNNITINLQLENEQLKNKIQELMNANNNLLLNDKIISGNNNLQNNDFISKIKELTLENQKYKESISKTKESITKLESDINKKNEELEGMKTFIYKLQKELEQKRDEDAKEKKHTSSINIKNENETSCNTEPNRGKSASKKDQNKSFGPKDANTNMINNILNQLNDANKQINTLQKKNKDLQYQLEVKQVEKDLSGFRTEDVNFSNYEEEFDLKKMVNGARDKNRSEDINIDYPGVQGIKDKYKELLQNMNMLEEQVKILLCNISCNSKIKPQITQICQLMRIPAKNIQMIIAGKDKKKALGLMI